MKLTEEEAFLLRQIEIMREMEARKVTRLELDIEEFLRCQGDADKRSTSSPPIGTW